MESEETEYCLTERGSNMCGDFSKYAPRDTFYGFQQFFVGGFEGCGSNCCRDVRQLFLSSAASSLRRFVIEGPTCVPEGILEHIYIAEHVKRFMNYAISNGYLTKYAGP